MQTYTVSQVNTLIKSLLDTHPALSQITVSGELSNYKRYPSGHHYFTLKDGEGVLKSVMFRNEAARLRFQPQDGMKVLVSGRVTVYPRDGAYQLYCQQMMPDGQGALQLAYQECCRRLEAEGLFDPRHKKPLPLFPERVVLITSPAGAAVQDMIRILGRRWPMAEVLLLPVRVQGDEAPGEIAAALQYANRHRLGDVIITGRGGGSLEDLWAFNEEVVARAIFASVIPVVSAVGHEPDVTIADHVADVRAATPSHAAELVVPDQAEWTTRIANLQARFPSIIQSRIEHARLRLAPLQAALDQPARLLDERRQHIDSLLDSLTRAWDKSHQPRRHLLSHETARLDALSPNNVLARGYAICQNIKGETVRNPSQAPPDTEIQIRLTQGKLLARVIE